MEITLNFTVRNVDVSETIRGGPLVDAVQAYIDGLIDAGLLAHEDADDIGRVSLTVR